MKPRSLRKQCSLRVLGLSIEIFFSFFPYMLWIISGITARNWIVQSCCYLVSVVYSKHTVVKLVVV